LSGKVAIVTGGASGIGAACVRLFAARGAHVIVADRDGAAAKRIADDHGVSACQTDVTDAAACDAMVEFAMSEFGRLDIAVNNAGIAQDMFRTAELPPDVWRRVLTTNLDGAFYCMRAEIPAMLQQGGGSIVNMASALGVIGQAGTAAYTAAKHGVVGLTRTAAIDYSKRGVRVNAVGPGVIETPLNDARFGPGVREKAVAVHPIGRLGRADDVAELVGFLASDASGFCTGGFYPVDGGWTAQ
jgi:NAD(P)-dependent dehydrogenase (short-subunit alcohol dehydrogenase family)